MSETESARAPRDDAIARLRDELGDGCIGVHEPVVVDGFELDTSVSPRDGEQLARALAIATEMGTRLVVRGGGSRLTLGNRPSSPALLLSTRELDAIDELDAEDGVVHVQAGTPLSALRERALAAGWELPLDPPGEATTVGGTLAAAAIGPRRLAFGRPRDCVLGMGVALASGERTHCGGRVVKNVTGYDMAKLYTGSLGTLGVIETAWLKLRPRPAHRGVQTAMWSAGASAAGSAAEPSAQLLDAALVSARRPSAYSVALLSPNVARRLAQEDSWLLIAEYAGDEKTALRDLSAFETDLAPFATTAPARERSLVDALRVWQGEGALRARISLLPGALPKVFAPLLAADLEVVCHPGIAIVYAALSDASASVERRGQAIAAIEAAARAVSGDLVFEVLPLEDKRGRDVFGDPGPRLPLMRALKQRFDPNGTLNGGRFQGML